MIVGQKDDERKPRTDLYPPGSLLEIARVLGHGADKYCDNGYREVPDATRRYTAAALRHVLAFMQGERVDPESGLHHLAHAACSLMFVIEMNGDCKDFTNYSKPKDR